MNLKKFFEVVEKSYINVRFTDEDEGGPTGLVEFDKEVLEKSKVLNVNFENETFYILVQDLRV